MTAITRLPFVCQVGVALLVFMIVFLFMPNYSKLVEKYKVITTRSSKTHDDLLEGKSCLRELDDSAWTCRDCGSLREHARWIDCPIAQRRGTCPPPPSGLWDAPMIRARSEFVPTKSHDADLNVLTHFGMKQEFAQVPCKALEDCWDLDKCRQGLTVYAYGDYTSRGYKYADMAARRYPNLTQHVKDPGQACLLLLFRCDAFENPTDMTRNPYWNEGKNHFIFESNLCAGSHADRPFPTGFNFNYGKAAIGASSLQYANLRRGYDLPLLLTHERGIGLQLSKEEFSHSSSRKNRPLLLVFKGNIFNWDQIWWQHRWMAYEYWHDQSDVVVDVTCPTKEKYSALPYNYTQLLGNAKFAFCPGGGGTHSYRLGEALALGAIPVVTPDLPEPLDLEWSNCWVRVSEARIIDLPRLLRRMNQTEIASRQARCRQLFETTLGWVESGKKKPGFLEIEPRKKMFLTAIKVWSARIESAIRLQERKKELEST